LQEAVPVDGSRSHTHAQGQTLQAYTWMEGTTTLATGVTPNLLLGIGPHNVTLEVTDSAGNKGTDFTTVTVYAKGYPVLTGISPTQGVLNSDVTVTMKGAEFTTATMVKFGITQLTGTDLTIVNDNTITVKAPMQSVAVPVQVSVVTPVGESNKFTYTYVGAVPIAFSEVQLLSFPNPTAVIFGPDLKLYVANTSKLRRLGGALYTKNRGTFFWRCD
jgi:IPT/TIG domain